MKVYVIRHGVTELNKKHVIHGHNDEGLAPEGIEQAKEAAPFIPKSIKHIYTSSLLRAKQTAEILDANLHVPISFHDELREVDFGSLNGTDYTDEVRKKHRSLQYDWHPQNGESVNDVKERLLRILGEIKSKSKDSEALIVTHGGVIRMMHFLEQGILLDEVENVSLHGFDLDKILRKYSRF